MRFASWTIQSSSAITTFACARTTPPPRPKIETDPGLAPRVGPARQLVGRVLQLADRVRAPNRSRARFPLLLSAVLRGGEVVNPYQYKEGKQGTEVQDRGQPSQE